MKINETRLRSIAKALSWRFIATFITAFIVWCLTKKADFAFQVGILDTTLKLLVYFFHERAWLRISFGKKAVPDFEI